MTRVRRHPLVIGGVSLAGAGLAVGLWLAVPAYASSSSHVGTTSSRGSGTAITVNKTAASRAGLQDWVPAGSGPPPAPPSWVPPAKSFPNWVPAGSGPPPAPSGLAKASVS